MPKPKLATEEFYPHIVQDPDTGEVQVVYKPYQPGQFASDEEYEAARAREGAILGAGASEASPGGFAPPSKAKVEAIVGPGPAGPSLEEQMAAGRLVKDEQPAADVGVAETDFGDEDSELEALIKQLQINDVAKASSGQDIFNELTGQSIKFSEEIVGYGKSLEQLFSSIGVAAPKPNIPQPTDADVVANLGPMPTNESVLAELRASEKINAKYEGKAGAASKYSETWAYVQQEPSALLGGTAEKVRTQAFNDIYQQKLRVWNEGYDRYVQAAYDDYTGQMTSTASVAGSKVSAQIELYKLQEQLLDQQIQSAWYRGQLEDAATARVQQRQIEALRGRLTKRGQDIDLQVAEMGDRLERWKTGWDAVKFFSANPSAYFVAQQLAGGMPLLTAWGAPNFRKLATKFFQDTAILSAQQLAQMSPTERQFYLAGKGMQGLSPEDLAALTERLTPKQPRGQKKVTRERA